MVRHFAVGGLRMDYFILPDGQARLRKPGGNARFAALGMRLCAPAGTVGVCARVTPAYPGAWMRELEQMALSAEGVRLVDTYAELRTFYAYNALWEREDRNPQAHFAAWGLPLPLELQDYDSSTSEQASGELGPMSVRPDDVPVSYWQAQGMHLCPLDYRSQWLMAQAMRRANPQALITLDAGERYMLPGWQAQLDELLQAVDVFLPSLLEVNTLCGRSLDRAALSTWLTPERWPHLLLGVKMGAEGCLIRNPTGDLCHIPAYPAKVAQVVGAGDCFCGAFHVVYCATRDPLEAALYASAAASLLIEELENQHVLTRREEIAGRVAWLWERVVMRNP